MVFLKKKISRWAQEWRHFASIPFNAWNVVISAIFLEISYQIAQIAAVLATNSASSPVRDIVFDHLPRIDTGFIHGPLSFALFDLRYLLFLLYIRYAPFAAKALGAIILFRAVTINLTHLGMPEGIVPVQSWLTFGGDLFFSGHVANTFMLGLVFWNVTYLRYLFLFLSGLFGISAVLGHYHYSIDVISAPFFAYGIFVIMKKLFPEDYKNTMSSVHK